MTLYNSRCFGGVFGPIASQRIFFFFFCFVPLPHKRSCGFYSVLIGGLRHEISLDSEG